MIDGFKTILGIAITVAPLIASLLGYDTSPDFQGDATEFASALVSVAGAIYALYGRMVARTPGWFAKKS